MKQIRLIGAGMFVYGAVNLVLLATPWREWALEHSVAHAVSASDRRAGNGIDGAVNMPMAIAGGVIMTFSGLWFGVFVPWVVERSFRRMREQYRERYVSAGTTAGAWADGATAGAWADGATPRP